MSAIDKAVEVLQADAGEAPFGDVTGEQAARKRQAKALAEALAEIQGRLAELELGSAYSNT